MELRDYAAGILLGRSLPEKLFAPDQLTDQHPGPAETVPDFPGREPELRPQPRRLPPPRNLEPPEKRGELLHFFANHELLALELMALMLLRFPQAPRRFRLATAAVMREEQLHLRLYLERMRDYGTSFGEHHLNDFFWKHLSGVRDVQQFSAGMALTFEQANLDFAIFYQRAFAKIGDGETVAILERVLEDEVGHVRRGLQQFDRARPKRSGLWQEYVAMLPPGLDAIRAKGPVFFAEVRRRAGFPNDFIESLRHYRRSRGRPPLVYGFDPFVELDLNPGRPPKLGRGALRLCAELAPVMSVFARNEDRVLVGRNPSREYQLALEQCGFALPEYASRRAFIRASFSGASFLGAATQLDPLPGGRAESVLDHSEHSPVPGADGLRLGERHTSDLRPWGWSPRIVALLREQLPRVVGAHGEWLRQKLSEHPDVYADRKRLLVGKDSAARLSAACGEGRLENRDWFVCQNQSQLLQAVSLLHAGGRTVLLRPVYGAAGRGQRIVTRGQRVRYRTFPVFVEPYEERMMDFSVHLDLGAEQQVDLIGWTRQIVLANGGYLASYVGRLCGEREFAVLATEHERGEVRLSSLRQQLVDAGMTAGRALAQQGAWGPVGLDAFLYRSPKGPVLRPVVDVNLRYSMGRVALEAARRLQSGRSGLLIQVRRSWLQPSAGGFARMAKAIFPATARELREAPAPLLRRGILPLTDIVRAQRNAVLFVAGESVEDCRDQLAEFLKDEILALL